MPFSIWVKRKIYDFVLLSLTFHFLMRRNYGIAVRIYCYDIISCLHIPVFTLSHNDSIRGTGFHSAPACHILRIQREIPFYPYNTQFCCMQFIQIHQQFIPIHPIIFSFNITGPCKRAENSAILRRSCPFIWYNPYGNQFKRRRTVLISNALKSSSTAQSFTPSSFCTFSSISHSHAVKLPRLQVSSVHTAAFLAS